MSRADVTFERLVLDGIARLLLDEHDLGAAVTALEAAAARSVEIPAILAKHKVLPIAAVNLDRIRKHPRVGQVATSLLSAMSDQLEDAAAHRTLLRDELTRLAAVRPRSLLEGTVLLKGFCNGRFYPAPYERWMRDIDLFCADWRSALALVNALLLDGYEFDTGESPWVKADPAHGRDLYGQVFLLKIIQRDVSRVDVHFGTYSAGYAGYLRRPLGEETERHTIGGVTVEVLQPADCLLVAAAHALSDGYISIKDVNDFVAVAAARQDVDWAACASVLADHQLAPQVRLLARHVLALYKDPSVRAAAGELLSALGKGPAVTEWRAHNRSWRLRATVNAVFAYRWERDLGGRAPRATRMASQCFLYYVRRLKLEVRHRGPTERLLHGVMAHPDLGNWRLRPDACTLLVDADVVRRLMPQPLGGRSQEAGLGQEVAEGIELLHHRGHLFVRMLDRTYVPTLDLLISPGHATALPS